MYISHMLTNPTEHIYIYIYQACMPYHALFVYTYIYICIYIYIYMCVCVRVFFIVYIYIYTYQHIGLICVKHVFTHWFYQYSAVLTQYHIPFGYLT